LCVQPQNCCVGTHTNLQSRKISRWQGVLQEYGFVTYSVKQCVVKKWTVCWTVLQMNSCIWMATRILKITDTTGWIIPDYYTGCCSMTLKLEYDMSSVSQTCSELAPFWAQWSKEGILDRVSHHFLKIYVMRRGITSSPSNTEATTCTASNLTAALYDRNRITVILCSQLVYLIWRCVTSFLLEDWKTIHTVRINTHKEVITCTKSAVSRQ
jgi:hypothetical protein